MIRTIRYVIVDKYDYTISYNMKTEYADFNTVGLYVINDMNIKNKNYNLLTIR